MDSNLIQALYISVIGLSVVFIFLTLLIILCKIMSYLVNSYFAEELKDGKYCISTSAISQKSQKQNSQPKHSIIVAISAAIHQHRKNKRFKQ